MTCPNTESVLQLINQQFITLDHWEVTYNNKQLKSTLEKIIEVMRNDDPLFNTLYRETYYGGSFFDDLKVGKPDEFDLDLVLMLPKTCQIHKSRASCGCIEMVPSNKPGYFWFKVEKNYYEPFNKFIKNGYVQTDLVLSWLQSLLVKALNEILSVFAQYKYEEPTEYIHRTPSYNSQSGPALTLRLFGQFGEIDLDLVPAFKVSGAQWPNKPYRPNTSTKKPDFFIVPKKAKGIDKAERYWRLSFQDQERELINQKERLKPALRLLKKLRSNLNHCSISSYALKTIVLWELNSFNWNKPLSYVFLRLLEKYRDSLKNEKITYYWNSGGNLLEGIRSETLINHCNEITKKINNFKKNCDENPIEIAKMILKENSADYRFFVAYLKRSDAEWELVEKHMTAGYAQHNALQQPSPSPSSSSSSGWLIAGAVGLAAAAALGFGVANILNRSRK